MGNHDHRVFKVPQEALQPGDGLGVQMVGGLVQQQDIRIAEQRLGQQHLHLVIGFQLAHHHAVLGLGDAQMAQERGRVGFGFPTVQLGKLALQFRGFEPVLVAEVGLHIQRVLFLHDFVQPLVAHDYGIHYRIFIIGKVILLQATHPLIR